MPTRQRTWTPLFDHFSRYSHYEDCVGLIWRNIGASGLREEELLLPYQRRLFSDLTDGLDEQAMSHLYDWWDYDHEALFKRGRQWRHDVPAEPRIEIELELTTKGNLRCEWRPYGVDRWGNAYSGERPDWLRWWRSENRSGGWDSRPSNELFFLHEVEHALGTIRYPREDQSPVRMLDQVFLLGICGLIDTLKTRLDYHFKVTMVTDVFVTWEPAEHRMFGETADRMVSWEIDDPERRQNDAELKELDSIEDTLGFSEQQFETLWAACAQKKKSGPSPAPENVSPKVAKALREQGLRNVTAHETNRVRYLIDKHRRSSSLPPSAQVLAFRKSTDPA